MITNLLQLPDDILVTVLKELSIADLHNVILTCKTLRSLIISSNTIWRSYFKDRLILNMRPYRNCNQLSLYNQCRISSNWCNGVFKNKVLVHFLLNYMPWIKLHHSELLLSMGSELQCCSIKKKGLPLNAKFLWKLNVPTVKRNDVRTNDISRFAFKDNVLVCGNRDGSTAIYTVENIKERPNFMNFIENCHKNGKVEVSAVEIMTHSCGSYAITASSNHPHVMIWDCTTSSDIVDRVMDIPVQNCDGVRCLALASDNNRLAMGLEGNSKPVLFDVNVGSFMMTCNKTIHWNEALRDIVWHDENTIASVSHSGLMQLIDVRTHDIVREMKDPFHASFYCLKTDGKYVVIVGSCEHSRCVLYDVRQLRRSEQLYFTHRRSSPVYSLDFDYERLVTAVDQGISGLNFNVITGDTYKRDYSYVIH